MPDTKIEFALEGEVTLEEFSEAVNHFNRLLRQLALEVAPDVKIEWELDGLEYGSAVMEFTGRAEHVEPIFRVVSALEEVGESLQQHTPIPYSEHVAREAKALTKVIRGDITALRLGNHQKPKIIYGGFDTKEAVTSKQITSFGTIKGRVQSISSRKKLQFTLYDILFDKPIRCYIEQDRQSILKDIWDEIVFVSGYITRHIETGQPISVRNITSIDFVPIIEPGSYRKARGILAGLTTNNEPSEISIRRLRDVEN